MARLDHQRPCRPSSARSGRLARWAAQTHLPHPTPSPLPPHPAPAEARRGAHGLGSERAPQDLALAARQSWASRAKQRDAMRSPRQAPAARFPKPNPLPLRKGGGGSRRPCCARRREGRRRTRRRRALSLSLPHSLYISLYLSLSLTLSPSLPLYLSPSLTASLSPSLSPSLPRQGADGAVDRGACRPRS